MANYPQELAQDAVCQSHTGHMTGLWYLPARPLRLNTTERTNFIRTSNGHYFPMQDVQIGFCKGSRLLSVRPRTGSLRVFYSKYKNINYLVKSKQQWRQSGKMERMSRQTVLSCLLVLSCLVCNCCWLTVCIVVVVLCIVVILCVFADSCLVCIVVVVLCVLL